MLLCGVLVFISVFVGRHECFQTDENSNKLSDAEWRCDSVCVGSGGIAELDLENKICKCTLDKNMDDAEKEMYIKNASAMGVRLVFNQELKTRRAKREVDTLDQSDQIVGQRAPNRLVTPRTRPSIYSLSTTRRSTTRRPVTPIRWTTPKRNVDMQQRLQQLQKRMNDRRRSRTRNRGGPRLQQRAGFQSDPHEDLMERVRKMQQERQEKRKNKLNAPTAAAPSVAAAAPPKSAAGPSETSPVIGASHNAAGATNHQPTNEESGTGEKNHHFEIITQDPSLYKDDD